MSNTDIEGITGRDNYIQAQALVYAIAMIQSLPEDRQEWSNMRDMCAIARNIDPSSLTKLIYDTQRHTGTTIDIWPDHDEDLSERDRREKKAFKLAMSVYIREMEERYAAFLATVEKEGA